MLTFFTIIYFLVKYYQNLNLILTKIWRNLCIYRESISLVLYLALSLDLDFGLSLLYKKKHRLVGILHEPPFLVLTNTPSEYIKYLSIIFLFLINILNIFGVKKVGKVQLFVVIVSILGLISLLFLGIPQVKKEYINPFIKYGKEGLMPDTITLYFVYVPGKLLKCFESDR